MPVSINLSRRGFVSVFSAGIVGACVASKIPTAWIPTRVKTYAACEFLRREYWAFCDSEVKRGIPALEAHPKRAFIGLKLHDAYVSELTAVMRFGKRDGNYGIAHVLFKG